MSETTIRKTTPSQWINIWNFFGASILAIASIAGGFIFPDLHLIWLGIIPAFLWAGWKWLVIRCEHYELTTQRLRITQGVFNQIIDEIELYRIKDITMTRSFWMRLIGLSSIHLKTSDRSLPNLEIPAITQGDELREQLREQVEIIRDRKRVREMDFSDTENDTDFDGDMGDFDLGG
jgi:uncharacterized membrane protein YdbT with pleckstrin-like domain